MRNLVQSKRAVLFAALAAAAPAAACSDAPFVPVDSTPALDARLRQAISPWGVVPILPVNAPDPALASLGKMLFFDKVLSGNRDVACASCHSPTGSLVRRSPTASRITATTTASAPRRQ